MIETFSINRLKSLFPSEEGVGCEVFGKTGTNNDCRTSWFCASTPELTTAIYIGSDNNQSLGKHVFGSRTAFPIWLKMHQKIAKNKTNFYYDSRLQKVYINWINGNFNKNPDAPNTVCLLA